jgi:hypothetical protein
MARRLRPVVEIGRDATPQTHRRLSRARKTHAAYDISEAGSNTLNASPPRRVRPIGRRFRSIGATIDVA